MRFNKVAVPTKPLEHTAEYLLYKFASNYTGNDLDPYTIKQLMDHIKVVDPIYVAKLAVYVKRELNRRTAPLFLLALMACEGPSILTKVRREALAADSFSIRKLVPLLVHRPDEICELMSMCAHILGKAKTTQGRKKTITCIPNSIKRGIADIFEGDRFKEFHYSKWDRAGEITLRDALFTCRPKALNKEKSELFAKIANRKLTPAETHERKIGMVAQSGLSDEEKRMAKIAEWMNLLSERKVSHIAIMREMKHILQLNAVPLTELVLKQFVETSSKSNVMPHNYIVMLREIYDDVSIDSRIKVNVDLDTLGILRNKVGESLKIFGERCAILVDMSGSMTSPMNTKSSAAYLDAALAYAIPALQIAASPAIAGFGVDAKALPFAGESTYAAYLSLLSALKINPNGTSLQAGLEIIKPDRAKFDTVLVFTDMGFNQDVHRMNQYLGGWGQRFVFVNLNENGSSPVKLDGKCTFLTGLNENTLKLYDLMKQGKTVVDAIREYEVC